MFFGLQARPPRRSATSQRHTRAKNHPFGRGGAGWGQRTNRKELAAQDALPVVGMPTYVLGHALNLATFERELLIGHSRYNDDLGSPWHGAEPLSGGTDGDPIARAKPGPVSPRVDEPDVAVRLRPTAASENAN